MSKCPLLLAAVFALAGSAEAEVQVEPISGEIVQRYYPNPNLKIITHLFILSDGKSYLVLDHPDFANLAVGDKTSLYAAKGQVYDKTGDRIWYYVTKDKPSPVQIQAAADAIYQKYRIDIIGSGKPGPE